jgi:hypothetical protein
MTASMTKTSFRREKINLWPEKAKKVLKCLHRSTDERKKAPESAAKAHDSHKQKGRSANK